MSTNYYLKLNVCPCCGHAEKELHIGKSSMGWQFTFHGIKELGLTSKKAWFERLSRLLPSEMIVNEYDDVIFPDDFKNMVRQKQRDEKHNHARECYSRDPDNWVDEEGHSFSGYEFS